jgi:hypothetical protein
METPRNDFSVIEYKLLGLTKALGLVVTTINNYVEEKYARKEKFYVSKERFSGQSFQTAPGYV